MWIPVTIDDYVKVHLKKNPNENEKVLRVRIEAALDDYNNGVKCHCGKDIWVAGSATAPFACFSCITGKSHPQGEYEIDSALDKRDKDGRRNIDEMDPGQIGGIFTDEGYEIDPNTIKKPSLCLTCVRDNSHDWEDDVLCNLNRYDQRNSRKFKCGSYEKI
jgi:hypothetical protein